MADENAFIEVTEGPDRGARLKVAADFAKAAIKAGWARDANVQPGDPEDVTPDKRAKAVAAAIKGMRKLRGEPDEDGKVEAAAEEPEEPEEGEDDGDYSDEVYQTTDMKPAPKRGPGRPRTR